MMKAYPEYKESGINWLGEVPSHWLLSKNKFLAKFTKGKNPTELHDDKAPSLYPYLAMDFLRGKNNSPKYAHLEKSSYLVKDGQNLIIWDGSNAGEFVVGKEGILSSTMAAGELSNKVTAKFYKYLTTIIEKEMRRLTVGMGIPHVDGSELNNLSLPLPESFQEQEKIADYLDVEVGRVDNLISEKENFIKLLSEKRQALISHVVTKGLNPNVPMKDSSSKWNTELPKEWKEVQFRRVVHLSQGLQIAQTERLETNESGSLEYITIKSINAGESSTVKEYVVPPSDRVICSKNDVLMARTGATGQVVTGVEGVFHNNFFKVSFNQKIDKTYLVYLLSIKELKEHLLLLAGTTTIPDLNHGDFLGTRIPLPSIEEQTEIVNKLNAELSKINALNTEVLKSIALLKEHRIALISAAVTGKVDVREEVK